MPRPPTDHRHPHSNARQFDLFCDRPDAAAETPQWQALPAATRHTLTKLMVRPDLRPRRRRPRSGTGGDAS
jgi:hypothetical protein